jgi:hypothetical protein
MPQRPGDLDRPPAPRCPPVCLSPAGRGGASRSQAEKSGKLPTQAFFTTDLTLSAARVVERFVWRWSIEVTFEETRRHLGVETQRQWTPLAIARTTPRLLALFSLVCPMVYR